MITRASEQDVPMEARVSSSTGSEPGVTGFGPDATVAGPDAVLAIARGLARELHPDAAALEQLGPDASIEHDFGLDSLARVELGLRIERTLGVELPDGAFAEAETIADLARALRQAPAHRAAPKRVLSSALPAGMPVQPRTPTTLVDALELHCANHPDRLHVLFSNGGDEHSPLSFGELRADAIAVAAGLKRAGIRAGETVAIMLPTGREFFAAFYGTLYAQAIPVPLYPPARASQIEAHLRRVAGILANCEARLLLTFARARRLAHLLRGLQTRLEQVATVEEIVEREAVASAPALRAADVAFLQYTSGSTGQPKGVVLTHANLLANLRAMQRVTGATSADRFVSWLPLYHDMGLIGACFGALVYGFPLVLMSPLAFLARPLRWLNALHIHGATITAAPNFAYDLACNKIDEGELEKLDLRALRLAFNGAEAVSPRTLERFADRFARCGLRRSALMPVYGLAECSLGLTFPPVGRGPVVDRVSRSRFLRAGFASPADRDDPAPLQFVSCGPPIPGHALRVVGAPGEVLPERMQGRIEFRGPSATPGYFRNPAETARLFDGEWLDTGDLGYLADGELYVTGRAKDIIIRGGHNVHPQELEEAVAQLPGVRKGGVAVFPAADRVQGTERIVVVVESLERSAQARTELVARVNRLALDLIGLPVDEVLLAPPRSILKTSSGKLRRSACREAYERGELGARPRPAWRQLARLAGEGAIAGLSRGARRLGELAWGLRALASAACLAPLAWVAVVAAPGLRRRRRIAAAFARLAMRFAGIEVRVVRAERKARGPAVVVANHASYLDSVVLIALLPGEYGFVAKRELRGSFALGHLLEAIGCLFVARSDVHEATLDAAELQSRLQAGESLVVFPEGTFTCDAGLLPFHMGAFSVAAAAGAEVVPVALRGTRTMLPDSARLPRPATLELVVGEPLRAPDASWKSAVELRRAARAHILAHLHEPDLEQIAAGNGRAQRAACDDPASASAASASST
jgi:1-acyl-sn-glycerol-3-phosphate acyltransferase